MYVHPIVVGYDGSTAARAALRWAADAAVRHEAPLRLVYAVRRARRPPPPHGVAAATPPEDEVRRDPDRVLARAVDGAVARARGAVAVSSMVTTRPAATILCDEAARATFVVVGRGGVPGYRGGSTCTTVVSLAAGPVVVVPDADPADPPTGPVVVGADGTAEGQAAIGFAFDEAAARGVAVAAIRIWSPPAPPWRGNLRAHLARTAGRSAAERAVLAASLAGWLDKHPGVPVTTSLIAGDPGPALALFSQDAHLLVVGRDDG